MSEDGEGDIQEKGTAVGTHRPRAVAAWPMYVASAVVAAVVAGALSYSFLGESLAALGIPDPGVITTFGLPFLRGMAWMLMALATGSWMFSAFLIPPDALELHDAHLTVDGHIASRTASLAMLGVAAISLVMVPLVLSDVSGTPFADVVFAPGSWALALDKVADAQVWGLVALFAMVVGFSGLIVGGARASWGSQVALFLGSIVVIMPLGMSGHSAAGGNHDYGTNSYLWHLTFLVIWVGGLMALVAHGRRLGPHQIAAVKRYSVIALFAFFAMMISGVVNALIRVRIDDLLSTAYGGVILAKVVGLAVLGLLGFAHRQITIPQLATKPALFGRVAFVEVLVMALVTGLAVSLGRTPPPAPVNPNLTAMEIQMGYNLYEAPGFWKSFTMWRFEVLFSVIAILLAVYYLHLTQRVKGWDHRRTAWWLAGCALIVVTLSSGIGMYMPAAYSMHMVVHMTLSMGVPVFLVMGAPLTLVKEAFPAGEFNARAWVEALEQSTLLRVVTYPPINTIQFLVIFYVLYLFPSLYALAISEHAGHVIMNLVFLVSGYIYFWDLIGPDHIPHRQKIPMRFAWFVGSMPLHLFMGVYLMQLNVVLAEDFYHSLQLPWDPDLLKDQKVGGGIGWGSGSFPLAIVFMILLVGWLKEDRAEARERDRREDESEDEEWRAYNEMLAQAAVQRKQR
ncbi:bifunctional copper resistance protein CopD/cytochrome c oxidase assembly protein [Corynebacterium aquatimens]|uniref:Copper resistance protein D n=1 Tax=Corynebacterium aquatimens TaxID=1190508 RepID=A0A931GSN0_9CORY|nr:cytochrome c oxidase assembly protein [Corynebacterium aquatimens]MBG6122217.1 putative copper resistance protein D [Corynebacterium aquatimens]WJY65242.1 Cytochrome c oxidase caa3 assembly factor [Corynebacterium aquatimens]